MNSDSYTPPHILKKDLILYVNIFLYHWSENTIKKYTIVIMRNTGSWTIK